jgi:hypothetical protein
MSTRIGFALGGLSGNNAHGAGFLHAALTTGVAPEVISCTSGQIYWVYRYLRYRKDGKETLRQHPQDQIRDTRPIHNRELDWLYLLAFGKPGHLRPAYQEFWLDLLENWLEWPAEMLRQGPNFSVSQQL